MPIVDNPLAATQTFVGDVVIIPGTALRGLEKLITPSLSCLCAFRIKSTVKQEGISAKCPLATFQVASAR